jgi:hypothetical protein
VAQSSTFACPRCGAKLSTATLNYTPVATPTAAGWTVIVLSCPMADCLTAIGTYTYPPPSKATASY